MFQRLRNKLSKKTPELATLPFVRDPLSAERLEGFHLKRWQTLNPDIQNKAIAYLRAKLPPQFLEKVKVAYINHGADWMHNMHPEWDEDEHMFYSFHFEEGMGVRNLLRKIIKDNELPSGNWDDYYTEALLRAAGCR